MTDFTAEVVKMEFANLMGTLPTYFETLNTQLAEAFAIDQETNQAFLEWDMITQMETLNTNILDSFTLLNESLLVLFEGFKEYLAEAFALKDELFQISMETLLTFLTESFAVSSELSTIQMEGLLAYLAESFALRDELQQTLLDSLLERQNEWWAIQGGNFELLHSILLNDIAIHFANLIGAIYGEFALLKEALDLDVDDVETAIETVTDAIDDIKEVLNEIKGWTSSQFFEDVKAKLENDNPTAFEKESFKVAKDANRLAIYGNELSELANSIAMASLEISMVSLSIEALPDIVKLGGGGALLAAAALVLLAEIRRATSPTLPTLEGSYAEGGIPGYGELFVAREAGPEFVGSFGSRNVVMNNDQIVAAVSGGVYDAVRRANAEQTQQPIYLNVEAKVRENVLFDMMETVKAERGVRLATGGAW